MLGILCAGQGSQTLDMFSIFADNNTAQKQINILENMLQLKVFPQIELTEQELFSNQYAQPLIAAHTYLIWQSLQIQLPTLVGFLGYSLGELTAYACTGAFDFLTLIQLAQQRAKFMDEAVSKPSGLYAIQGLNYSVLNVLCQQTNCEIAIVNSPTHFLIGGRQDSLKACEKLCSQQFGFKSSRKINVTVPSHTSLLSNASQNFYEALTAISWNSWTIPVIASISGELVYDKNMACKNLAAQISQTIYFDRCLKILTELGATQILEMGSSQQLTRITENLHLPVIVKSSNDFKNLNRISEWINKCNTEIN